MADIKKFLDRDGVSTLWSKVAQSVAAEKARAEAAEKVNADAIAGIKNGTAMNDFAAVEAKIATLQVAGDYSVNGHKHEIADVNGLQSALEAKGDKTAVEANATAIGTLEGKVAALEAGTYDDTEVRGLIKDNADAIDALEGAHATDKAALEASIKSNTDAIALLTNGVDADVIDGVNDLINYVNEHGTEVTGIKGDIAANAGEITTLKTNVTDLQSADTELGNRISTLESKFEGEGSVESLIATAKAEAIADAAAKDEVVLNSAKEHANGLNTAMDGRVAALETASATHALASDLTALDGRVVVVEGKVATLEGASHSHDNKEVLDGISSAKVAAWDAAETNAKAHADGLNSAMDVRVQALEAVDHSKFETAGAAATALTEAKAYTDTEFAKIQALTTAEIEAAIAAASQA